MCSRSGEGHTEARLPRAGRFTNRPNNRSCPLPPAPCRLDSGTVAADASFLKR